MPFFVKDTGNGGGDFEILPEGMQPAVCIWVYDIGTHWDDKWGKMKKEFIIGWEVPGHRIEINGEDLPMMASRKFTQSLSTKSNLLPFLEMWRGKKFSPDELLGFDIFNLLGVSGNLQIIHTNVGDRTYANVASITPLPKAGALSPEGEPKQFTFQDAEPIPEGTPKWIAKLLDNAKENNPDEIPNQEPPQQEDDIPF